MWHCFSHTIRTEGFRALYLSYPTTLVMNIPFQSIHFATYEYARHLFQSAPLPGFYSNSSSYSPASHLMAGAVAGAFAALLTTPLDVTKTLLQTRGISSCAEIRRTDSFLRAFALIYRRQGFWGYWRGAKARVIAHMPATAISWSVYEYFKWAFTNYSTFSSATTEYGNKEAIVTMQEQ
jgi:solute carrier family 25 iron transporter 28/37